MRDSPVVQLRVEQVAARTGVSVDTLRFYQKEGLVPPPRREGRVAYYGQEHLERIERVRELRSRGFTLAVIRRFLAGELDASDEPLVSALAGRPHPGEPEEEFFDLEELAARAGVPVPLVEAVAREGFLVPRIHGGHPRYTPSDVAAVRAGLRLLETGIPLPELFSLGREHHAAARAIARRAVELFDQHVRDPLRAGELTQEERAARLVEAFRTALASVTTLVAHHFQRVLLQAAQEHLEAVGDETEIAAAHAEAQRRLELVWSQ